MLRVFALPFPLRVFRSQRVQKVLFAAGASCSCSVSSRAPCGRFNLVGEARCFRRQLLARLPATLHRIIVLHFSVIAVIGHFYTW